MTTTTTGGSCAHEMCLCTRPYPPSTQATSTERVDPNAEYCSRRCSEQSDHPMGDDGCECGHPPCQTVDDEGIPEI